MALSYTKVTHNKTYAQIAPTLPHLSAVHKTVLIVGGSAGIGKATALAFLDAGTQRLALTGRREDALSSTAAEIAAKYPKANVMIFAVDVTDAKGMNDAVACVKDRLGPADVIVNSAGVVGPLKPLASSDLSTWWSAFETNVKGAAVLAQAVTKHASPSATFLQLSTAGVLFPASPGFPISGYAASKLAVTKIMEYFGAENPSLKVMNIHPGVIVDTPGGKKMVEESGVEFDGDDINLPAHFLVWAASEEAVFVKNKFVFATWDIDELKERKEEIMSSPELILGLNGFPRHT
ncbi:uncharacterized protein JN550_006269 [Neoarthrinium moseri]|uniref:uncharacterized protein n=1 Tax=Neoarthrinium moseri TaxID=1658444 RepID=UPI001FDB904C|nr:uncharacterized protein JN550_006269 [Neoarthrinium moseri]KAI1868694.1 hypothetical protein JN550_006269 [Neoarthrinium moseri]